MPFLLKSVVTKTLIICLLIFSNSYANDSTYSYSINTSGIKIGEFSWLIRINENNYETKVSLKSSGLLSSVYKFNGEYFSKGNINNNRFKTKYYRQNWQTKRGVKIIEIFFRNKVVKLYQDPKEKEFSRVNLNDLFENCDPITSFINILKGQDLVKTIDGRRIYTMNKMASEENNKVVLEIKDYQNIWADHKRNDLEKIEFYLNDEEILPEQINIYFKKRVFKLKKN